MISLSPRFAAASIALLVAAALPVWLHAATAPIHDDCANPAAFYRSGVVAGAEVAPLEHPQPGVEGVEGKLVGSAHPPLSVRVVRNFHPSQLYGSPIAHGFKEDLYLRSAEARRIEAGDDALRVHWSEDTSRRYIRFEAYAVVQGGTPVWHPLRSGLALGLDQLAHGTRPVTVLIVSGAANPEDFPALARAAEHWLAQAWQQLEAACGS